MTAGNPEPQMEYVRQLILTGDLEQFKALMELEASLYYDLTFRDPGRIFLRLLGPVVHGASICWLVHSDRPSILTSDRSSTGQATISWGNERISVTPDMTLQQIYDRAVEGRLNLCRALHLGLLRAIPLPHGCLRLLFALSNFDYADRFWLWVDGLTAELHRWRFRAAPPDEPSPPADEPGSLESSRSGWLAGQGSGGDQLAAGQDRPWMKIDDVGWDRRALELWWRGYTVPEIAGRLDLSPKTVGNRLSILRGRYEPHIVPTDRWLRTLNIK